MQYILSQEEYDELVAKSKKLTDKAAEDLQKACTFIADNVPVKYWGNDEARIWGCIHTKDHEWYCDECPAEEMCPSRKSWSK